MNKRGNSNKPDRKKCFSMNDTLQIALNERCPRPWRNQKRRRAFTRTELLVVIAIIVLLSSILLPALAKTGADTQSFQCLNNLKQITAAWKMYAADNSDVLLGAESSNPGQRISWMSGGLSFDGGNRSNWDPNQDLVKSPLWPYTGRETNLFKCPADKSMVTVNGQRLPRVRSLSMSQVFGNGNWLPTPAWRIYGKGADIVIPAKTIVFADEHPDSLNDGALAVQCQGADTPGAYIIDFPASHHNGAGPFSFADGRAEIHKWLGAKINAPVRYNGSLALNVPAGDSWVDVNWMAQNTTVKR
jgi:type II secretory pathway pseudopilin PulG